MEFIKDKILIAFLVAIFYVSSSANIDGIKIETIKAKMYGKVHIPLLSKRIKSKNDMFSLGQINASRSTKKLLEKDEFYIITLEDKYSKGKLHAIVKGDYLKKYPHYVSPLTEVAFLLSRDFIGDKYDKIALEKNLNKIAKKVIKKKGFILDNTFEIGYSDVLLYKPYKDNLKLLEKKIKNNVLTYNEAYNFVNNNKKTKEVIKKNKIKKVIPLYRLVVFLHIPQNTKIGTKLVKLEQLRRGSAQVESFEILKANMPFRVTKDGTFKVSSSLKEDSYSFEAIAHTKDGDSNKISFTVVIDKIKDDRYLKIK